MFETGPPKKRPIVNTTIWGQTCDAKDVILRGVMMPEVHIDDALVFEERGSYFISMSSNFNGFRAPFPKVALSKRAMLYLALNSTRFDRVLDAQINTFALEFIYLNEIIHLIPKNKTSSTVTRIMLDQLKP